MLPLDFALLCFLHHCPLHTLYCKTFDVWEAFPEIVVKMHVSVRMFGIGLDGLRSLFVWCICSCLHPLVRRVALGLGAMLVGIEDFDEMLNGASLDD
uniref:Uncharacterized protein n=1 Tax=Glossina pallidipes TaxID=7398 RepID=A0A1B0AEF0_GLOPL